MGTLVSFESKRLLLQREDFPAALKKLKKLAVDGSDLFRDPAAVRAAKDLISALEKGEFLGTLDAYGDLVHLEYVGEKLPEGAPDDFPDELVFAWKKLAPNAAFEGWIEGLRPRHVGVRQGKVYSYSLGRPALHRFEIVGPTPECAPGESVEVRVRFVSDDANERRRFALRGGKDSEGILEVEHAPKDIQPGEEVVVRVRVNRDAPRWTVGRDTFALIGEAGDDAFKDHVLEYLPLHVRDAIGDLDTPHEVVAAEWKRLAAGSGVYLPAKQVKSAHELVRRYSTRHKTEPGGAFLERVEAAPDFVAALKEASLEPTVDASGTVLELAFRGDRLPGGERHLFGLLASYERLMGFGRGMYAVDLDLAFRHAPDVWARFRFAPDNVRWWRAPRRSSPE